MFLVTGAPLKDQMAGRKRPAFSILENLLKISKSYFLNTFGDGSSYLKHCLKNDPVGAHADIWCTCSILGYLHTLEKDSYNHEFTSHIRNHSIVTLLTPEESMEEVSSLLERQLPCIGYSFFFPITITPFYWHWIGLDFTFL